MYKDWLNSVYPSADQIINQLNLPHPTPTSHPKPTLNLQDHHLFYVIYPDAYRSPDQAYNLAAITDLLPKLKKLGVTILHILPLFNSPMVDMGFDVSDYLTVREDLGGNQAFLQLIKQARRHGIRLMVDFVLNHVSDQHKWFTQAVKGNSFYRDFFIWRPSPPKVVRQYVHQGRVMVEYQDGDKRYSLPLIFPDFAGPIPHWRPADDGLYYYHTFYPHQLDLNWRNPQVFLHMTKIIQYWGKQGVSFRLDAIPHLWKEITTGQVESQPKTHLIVKALYHIAKQANPNSLFLMEACQPMDKLIPYFGSSDEPEADLAYNFPLSGAYWYALITGKTDKFWHLIQNLPPLPNHAQWINFARTHDELQLAGLTESEQQEVIKLVKGRGLPFRRHTCISARFFSLLGHNLKRAKMALTLLFLLPGIPMVVYGDEVGKPNDRCFYHQTQQAAKRLGLPADSRNLNRGRISFRHYQTKKGRELVSFLTCLNALTKRYRRLINKAKWRPLVPPTQGIIAAHLTADHNSLTAVFNLTPRTRKVPLPLPSRILLSNTSIIPHTNHHLILPPYACFIAQP